MYMKSVARKEDFCPVARVAELLGDPCTLLIIRDLISGSKRFKELEESLTPISSRTIAKKLKLLEEKKIIIRTEFKERPPRVVYELTKEGKHLHTLIDDMRTYGKKFLAA
jgi:DNA-binding HxlR family transcriptional regulator